MSVRERAWRIGEPDFAGVDAWKDDAAVGVDPYADEWPDPQRFGRCFLPADFVPGELRTASARVESQSRVHASSPTKTGRDGRGSAPSPPTSVAAALLPAAMEDREAPESRLSSRLSGRAAHLDTQTRSGGHPSGS